MNKNNNRKKQFITFMVCLFVILGSAAGCIIFNMFPGEKFISFIQSTQSDSFYGSLAYSAVIPCCILLSSALNFGIALSLFLTAINGFLCGCRLSLIFAKGFAFNQFFMCALPDLVLSFSCVLAAIFAIYRVIKKFSISTPCKNNLKRDRIKNNAENIIVILLTALLIFISCKIRVLI